MDFLTDLHFLEVVEVDLFKDQRGCLVVSESLNSAYFEVKRIYYISSTPTEESRGFHAHKKLKQLFFAVSGSFDLKVSDGDVFETVKVNAESNGYFLKNGFWRELSNFSSDAIVLVLASENYDAQDYIKTFDEFKEWRKRGAY